MDMNFFKTAQARDTKEYAPQALAYLGDAVFEMLARSHVVSAYNGSANDLHQQSKSYVNAVSQAQFYDKIKCMLTEEEIGIFKRGRNTKCGTKPKSATMADYHTATGVEALFGYLYLKKNFNRIAELFSVATAVET